MADTHPEALRVLLDLNHSRSAQQKYDQVVEMYETVVATYTAEERRLHPEASDLVRRAYGWAPDE
jgi:hypothetical protein